MTAFKNPVSLMTAMKANMGLILIAYALGIVLLVGGGYYLMRGKGPDLPSVQNLTNVTPQPTSNLTGVFTIDSPTPAASDAPANRCEDGTNVNTCNSGRQACLRQGDKLELVTDCTQCGCDAASRCNPLTHACFGGCEDGTEKGQCSNASAQYYCNSESALVLNGTACGCPRGYQYDPYGGGPDTVNDCRRTCRAGEDCTPGK